MYIVYSMYYDGVLIVFLILVLKFISLNKAEVYHT